MKKQQHDHVLRAAGRITGETQFLIIGSQSLHGKHPDLPDDIVRSAEVDLIAKNDVDRTEWLNAIGQDSPFHETFGYYADPVDEKTATLPKGWKGRLVDLAQGDTDGVKGLCLDPHDLAIAKYVARREKGSHFHACAGGSRNRKPRTTTRSLEKDTGRRGSTTADSRRHRARFREITLTRRARRNCSWG